ncbi:MAG TPA: glycosyltransferase family 2 protein [Pyrinomonadaceae bacterium]|nr:glycosyltransferase family 2 protein [Pyrinomonadaceae bacterium]
MSIANQLPKQLTLAVPCPVAAEDDGYQAFMRRLKVFASTDVIAQILVLHEGPTPYLAIADALAEKISFIRVDSWFSGKTIECMLEASTEDIILIMTRTSSIEISERSLRELLTTAGDRGVGFIYSDYRQIRGSEMSDQMTLNYQSGSIRESFDFGAVVYISKQAADAARDKYGRVEASLRWAGLYDLRLKISTDFSLKRIPESLYVKTVAQPQVRGAAASADITLGGLDSRNPDHECEVERVSTAHLLRIGAYLESTFSAIPVVREKFPVTASIVIPVRNRERTIEQAVRSALSQVASFSYNVIVVDHHSTDHTMEILRALAIGQDQLILKVASRPDLGIGGLWNEAVNSPECGLYALQLDSDDVYASTETLEKMVSKFWEPALAGNGPRPSMTCPRYAMTIGSFVKVDVHLQILSSGPFKQRQWPADNGRNGALRVDSPGAPRAFYVPVLRRLGFPNVSFGEDYAIYLRIGREYEVGRISEAVYLAREWEGNSVRSLPLGNFKSVNVKDLIPKGTLSEEDFLFLMKPILLPLVAASKNRYHEYKDWLRTVEIDARKEIRKSGVRIHDFH